MTTNEIRQLIYKAAETIDKGTEFDAKMIEEIIYEEFDEIVNSQTIGQLLPRMNFSQRRLEGKDLQEWRVQYGTRPRTVYKIHLGKNSRNYERGIGTRKSRPLLSEVQSKALDNEECSVCPEFDECQGQTVPCPRYPMRTEAPRDRVMRLGDFEND